MAISIRQQTGLAWSLALLPFGAIGMLHVNVPYHDQWDLLPLLDAYYQNRLTLTDFLAPHNGHILLFPQLLMLGLALLTQWHTGAEVLVSLLLTCLNYALLLRLLLPNHASTSAPLLRIGLSLLAFSFAQAENWIWGWQLQVPLCLSAVLAGILALQKIRSPLRAGLTAVACGVLASGSFAAGMVFWLAVLPQVYQRRDGLFWPWLLLTAVIFWLYFRWIGSPPALVPHTDTRDITLIASSVGLAKSLLVGLGSLIGRLHPVVAGMAGLLGLGLLAAVLRKKPRHLQHASWYSMVLFSIGTAGLLALSRGGMGLEQLLASRYTTLALPFWSVILMLLLHEGSCSRRIAFVLLFAILVTSIYSTKDLQRMHRRLDKGLTAFTEPNTPEAEKALRIINPRPDPALAREERALLQKYALGPYARNNRSLSNAQQPASAQ